MRQKLKAIKDVAVAAEAAAQAARRATKAAQVALEAAEIVGGGVVFTAREALWACEAAQVEADSFADATALAKQQPSGRSRMGRKILKVLCVAWMVAVWAAVFGILWMWEV